MVQSPLPLIEYATPSARRRRDPAIWPHLKAYGIAIFWQALLLATDVKFTPGGPFISIHAEVVPVVICLSLAGFGARSLFCGSRLRRAIVAVLLLMSSGIAFLAINNAVSYWRGPFSRGAVIGF